MLCLSFIVSGATPITVKVAVHENLARFYHSTLKQKQKQAVELNPSDMKNTRIGFVSLVLFIQALDKAGLAAKFEFINSPNSKRSERLVQTGDALFTMTTLSKGETPKDTLQSSVLLGPEGLLKGIYGLKSNHALMKVKTLAELKKFNGMAKLTGGDVNKILQEIGLNKLELSPTRKSILRHIAYKHADFVLLGITRATEHQIKIAGITLVPVPGALIQQELSHHFLISKNHPDSERVYPALEKGLNIMRQQGLIKKYYRQQIFFLDDFPHWKILNRADVGME